MDNTSQLLERISTLEAENRRLREREVDAETTLRTLIQKLPTPAAALDANLRLLYANSALIELLDYENRLEISSLHDVRGAELRNIVSRPMYEMIEGTHRTGEDKLRTHMSVRGSDYLVSAFSIRRGELTIVLIYNMNNPVVRTTEIIAQLTSTIDRNMRMIQNIAFLLGEEVSENAKELGAVIKTLQYPDEK